MKDVSVNIEKINKVVTLAQTLEKFAAAHIAIIGVSELDRSLERAILTKMRPLPRDMRDRLFDGYGSLANFAAKIDIAYALDIISKHVYDDLRTINRVRVKFAHGSTITTFEDPTIAEIVAKLPGVDAAIQDIKIRYFKRLKEIDSHLVDIYVQHCKVTRQSPTGIDVSLLP